MALSIAEMQAMQDINSLAQSADRIAKELVRIANALEELVANK